MKKLIVHISLRVMFTYIKNQEFILGCLYRYGKTNKQKQQTKAQGIRRHLRSGKLWVLLLFSTNSLVALNQVSPVSDAS